MIKVGIVGAESPMAGELIRILVNHPDVDLMNVCSPALKGRSIASVHHGLIGEDNLVFTDSVDCEKTDVIFIDSHSEMAERFRSMTSESEDAQMYPDLKIIDMSHAPTLDFDNLGMVYGLPELNRKKLVRGAKRAVVPRSVAGVSIISLLPLATHLLLKDDIRIMVECPDDIGIPDKLERALEETSYILSKIQQSYSSEIILQRVPSSHSTRALKLIIEVNCSVSKNELEKIYRDTFDDHNFTWITNRPTSPDEVEGTDKCVISIADANGEKIVIESVADCRMRGGAGDAIHIMNLMFGLHEKTGLSLKAHKY